MPQRRNIIACLLHAAQGQRGNHRAFWAILRLFQNRTYIARRGVVADVLRIYANAIEKIGKHRQLLRVRLFMHAVEQRQAVFAGKARHTFVSRQHEILDHHFRFAALTGDDFHRLAVFI